MLILVRLGREKVEVGVASVDLLPDERFLFVVDLIRSEARIEDVRLGGMGASLESLSSAAAFLLVRRTEAGIVARPAPPLTKPGLAELGVDDLASGDVTEVVGMVGVLVSLVERAGLLTEDGVLVLDASLLTLLFEGWRVSPEGFLGRVNLAVTAAAVVAVGFGLESNRALDGELGRELSGESLDLFSTVLDFVAADLVGELLALVAFLLMTPREVESGVVLLSTAAVEVPRLGGIGAVLSLECPDMAFFTSLDRSLSLVSVEYVSVVQVSSCVSCSEGSLFQLSSPSTPAELSLMVSSGL